MQRMFTRFGVFGLTTVGSKKRLGSAATLMFCVLSLQVAPAYGQRCSIADAGDVGLIVDRIGLVMADDSDLIVTAEETLFASLLMAETSRAVAQVIAEDSAVSAIRLAATMQSKSSTLALFAAVEPLSDAELTELAQLLNGGKPTEKDKKKIEQLLNRLQQAGLKFDGKDTLGILGKILNAGGKGLGGARGLFLKFYGDGLGIAVNGLGKFDPGKYERYKECRGGIGATHDECASGLYIYSEDRDRVKRRYELELLLRQVAQQTQNFFVANLGAQACQHLKVLLAAWDRIDVADARCTAPSDMIASSGDLLAVWGGAGIPVQGTFTAAEKAAARYFLDPARRPVSDSPRFKFLETNGFLSDANDGIGRGDVEQAIMKLQCP